MTDTQQSESIASDRERARADMAAKIEAVKTPAGGWKKKTLIALGVDWPPRKGWRRRLIDKAGEP